MLEQQVWKQARKEVLFKKYDLRFLQPNEDSLPTAAVHTLEHLLANLFTGRSRRHY